MSSNIMLVAMFEAALKPPRPSDKTMAVRSLVLAGSLALLAGIVLGFIL